jgi:DNA-binding transcriptional LysR family regulator
MIGANLRHLRVFMAVAECGSVTRAAEQCHVSQPAVTQAIAKLEAVAGLALFARTPQGLFPTEAGRVLMRRVARAMGLLDAALCEIAVRLPRTATRAQLAALIAVTETQNFSLAARRLGIAQPTAHRAVTQLEREAARPLFQRSAQGVVASRACKALARSARLAFVELDQAEAELGEMAGREVGEIVIGAMPLSRSHVLPRALGAFRRQRPNLAVRVLEGSYDELLGGLRRGEIDLLIGALRFPAPIGDVTQEQLFDDKLAILAAGGHPLLGGPVTVAALARWPWLVARQGTPTRAQFDAMFAEAGLAAPQSVIETGSAILMREMVQDGKHLACISHAQAEGEIARNIVQVLDFAVPGPARPIGVTTRQDWQPTPAQVLLLAEIRVATRGAAREAGAI